MNDVLSSGLLLLFSHSVMSTFCHPMDCSTPGFPVLHHLLELAIQSSHPLSSPSPPAFNLSQHQGLFQWVASGGQSIGASASVLPTNTQDWFSLGLTGLISFQYKGFSRVFPNTTAQKFQFFSAQLSQLSHPYLTAGKTISLTVWTFVGKVMSSAF